MVALSTLIGSNFVGAYNLCFFYYFYTIVHYNLVCDMFYALLRCWVGEGACCFPVGCDDVKLEWDMGNGHKLLGKARLANICVKTQNIGIYMLRP